MEKLFLGPAAWMATIVLAVSMAGCGSGSGVGGRGLPAFPSRARLDEIARAQSGPTFDAKEKTISTDDWQPSSVVNGAAADEQLVRTTLERGERHATPELGCAAREIARFMALKGGMPDQRIRNHMLGHCGATVPAHSFQSWSVDLKGSNESEASLLGRLGEPLRKAAGSLPAGASDIGGALARENDKAVFVLLFARRYANLSPVVAAPDGTVTVEGTILGPTQLMRGLINAGELGVAQCSFDQRMKFPRFRLKCPMLPSDASAWIEIARTEPGRLLAEGVVRMLVRRQIEAPALAPEGTAEAAATAPTAGVTASAGVRAAMGDVDPRTPADFRQKLLVAVNELRQRAGLAALELADRQSLTHEKLAPHFFASSGEHDDTTDDIALGLMAGYDVPGIIRDGAFYGIALSGTLSADRWLTHLLDYPAARQVLFAPEARALAVGPILDARSATLGALVSTYSFYQSLDHGADRQKAVELVNEVRRAAGSGPLSFVKDPEVENAARAIAKGADAGQALNQAMQQIAAREPGEVQGLIFETVGIEYLTFPDELIRSVGKVCALEVTHVRHRDVPWGNLVVVMVLRRSATTSAGAPTSGHL